MTPRRSVQPCPRLSPALAAARVENDRSGAMTPPAAADAASLLLDAFPPKRQVMAMTLFGFAALIAPVVGPALGGWLTDT